MGVVRAGGHVLGEHGWEIADKTPEQEIEEMSREEILEAIGGGWYLVGGQKVQGREAAEALLETIE